MLSISNLSIHFSGRYLFDNVNIHIGQKNRIGLIGRNGAGKSTLLKIIFGIEQPEDGLITKPNEYKVGYLPQEGNIESQNSIFAEASEALGEINQIEERIDSITHKLSNSKDYNSKEYYDLIQELNHLNERARILGISNKDAEIEKVLIGLGFERSDFDRMVSDFSGGWRMRIELAKILLSKPNLILLDEPTNHLDIESITWLENFLKNYNDSMIIVSHDTRFLDNITNRTIEINAGKVFDMPLAYSEFVKARELQKEQQISAFKNQQRIIKQTERFIERFRYKATLASRVQSRIKQLEKIDRIEIEEEDYKTIRFKFQEPPRSGKIVLEIKGLTKQYDKNFVLENIDLIIEREDKIAFIGKNGEGKSTLSRIIAGIENYDGNTKYGHNVHLGYFAQHQAEMLDGNLTVLETIDSIAQGEIRTQIRSLLGAFLFSGESVYKKVKVLSGGEKSRLALAKLLLEPKNFLILDEPTNHLDMTSKSVLKEALLRFNGTLIIVSHDRDFLDGLTNKTIDFKNKKISEFPGAITEYLLIKKIDKTEPIINNTLQLLEKPKSKQRAKLDREKQKKHLRIINQINKKIDYIETTIISTEEKIHNIEIQFSNPSIYTDPDKINFLKKEFDKLKNELIEYNTQWDQLHNELDELNKQNE